MLLVFYLMLAKPAFAAGGLDAPSVIVWTPVGCAPVDVREFLAMPTE